MKSGRWVSRLIVSATEEFRSAFDKLVKPDIPARLLDPVTRYYRERYVPELSKFMDLRPQFEQYMPSGHAKYYLQYYYIVNNPNPIGKKHYLDQAGDGSEYSRIHVRYHQELRKFVERFGYVDIFLIDHDTGQIFYTMLKEPDFATNLRTGPYCDTRWRARLRTAGPKGS
jgi:hypothetical protein